MDAPFWENHGLTGHGMCIRDNQGRFITVQTLWPAPLLGVHEGEAAGLLAAIRWVQALELENAFLS